MVKVAGDGSKQILIGVLAQVRKRRYDDMPNKGSHFTTLAPSKQP